MAHCKKISVYCNWETNIATICINRFGNKRRFHKVRRYSASAGRILKILQESPHIYYTYYGQRERGKASWHKRDTQGNTTHYCYNSSRHSA